MPLGSGGGGQPPSGVGGGGDCYGAPPTSSGGGPGAPMQNGAYSWVGPPAALSQKSWPPGYQASLTNLFLKKNPLHFGTGISQLAAASSYLEKMSTLGAADHHHKCPHPDAKDKPYPCDLCHKYLTICNTLRDQQQPRPSHGAGPGGAPPPGVGGGGGPPPLGAASALVAERKGGGPLLGSSASAQQPPPGQQQQQQQQQGAAALTPASLLERTNGHGHHHHHHGTHHGGAAAAGTHGGVPRPRPPPTKQFLCPVCHKYFTQKGNLKTHMMIHTGEKPYSCQVCGKSFTQKGNVDTHMKIHTGEKDFGCEACGKRFTQKGNLKTHVRSVHTKEKPFACGVCGKCFSQKGNMQTHMRTHNKEDRFPCTLCGKTFSQKGNLKTHMQRHTGQLPPRRYGSRGSRATQAVTGGLLHRPHLAAAAAAFASLASTSAQQQQPGSSSSPKPHSGGDKSPARGSGPPTPLSPDLRRGPSEDTSPGPPGGPDPPRPFYSAPPTPAPPPPHSPRWLVHPRHYDGGFQAPPYPSSLHHPPLASRLALLGAGSPQHQPHSGAASPDDKAPSQHLGSTGNPSGGDSFHSPANPDFSQLLE
ncbi:hypothetical protein HPB51_004967 [Rhipicephalus microplus]|uniref:C2H2-type domain-containing protein n=1 Tax=Rhipicephalus microplus TaxID=6941 RepID=A0A9J6EXE9_RHIMP|nr:zinc finger protein 628-like [Rhipicephalus microplus]KAH8039042.1 hypothetical protein HPB51_004967 [Rhipicephalus microplus]